MKIEQLMVKEFMQAAEQECPPSPVNVSLEVYRLRIDLIEEELHELDNAIADENLVEIADAIGDLLVVVLGTAVAHGIDITPVFEEIMRSNMTKFIDGHQRTDGKWIKGPSYSPANLAPILAAQSSVP